MLVIAVLLAVLAAYGLVEYRRHLKAVRAIPHRIHVNGTRGKSSVTRLIAGGLRAGGIRTIAKSTGTRPCLTLEDGREVPIVRPGGRANILEQLTVFRVAAARRAEAIVVECMALRPALQWTSEHRIVKATVSVITNARADHQDVMGPTVDDVARALSNTVAPGRPLFTAERVRTELLADGPEGRPSEVVVTDGSSVTAAEMRGFSYVEHPENVALALAVCERLGVPRGKALEGMYRAVPDPGVLRLYRLAFPGRQVVFANAFAANDRDSTLAILAMLGFGVDAGAPCRGCGAFDAPADAAAGEEARAPARRSILLFNSRGDRVQRAEQFSEVIARDVRADAYVLVGDLTDPVEARAVRLGADPARIVNLGNLPEEAVGTVFERLLDLAGARAIVVGVGNIGGLGRPIVDYIRHRGEEICLRKPSASASS
jgi:poly-gamma-glutamate synthase PgsB/CapB